jgi:anaerobic magnesium-protoporphyrin IX monomethyl ester cyclase
MIFFRNKVDSLFVDLGINFLGDLKGLHYGGYVPYGLLCVASFCEKAGYKTSALMMDHSIPEQFGGTEQELDQITREILEAEIKSGEPKVFGLGMPYTFQYRYMLRILAMVKEIKPDIITVVGGEHPSVLDKECMKESPHIDIIVRGEGEKPMAELLDAITNQKGFENVQGITYRTEDGEVVQTKRRTFMDMNEAPMVRFDMLPKKFFSGRTINISPTRGCEYSCRFCAERIFWGNAQRAIPSDRIVAEMESIVKSKLDYTFINLEDSMLDMRTPYYMEVMGKIAEVKDKRLGHFVTRVDSITDDGLAAANKAGVFAILYGVESGSEVVRDKVQKEVSIEDVKNALARSKKAGIYNGTLWVVGLPGDTTEEAEHTYNLMETLYSDELTDIAAISRLVPYPGTPIHARPDLYGVNVLHRDYQRWVRFTDDGCCELEEFSNDEISTAYTKIFTMARTMEFNQKKALKVTDIIRY